MSRWVICRSNSRIWSEVMRSMWFQKFWEESRAGSTGSRRVRRVRRYQSARCTLLVGATARLRAASRRYWPQDRPHIPPQPLETQVASCGDIAALWDIAQRLDLVPLLDSLFPKRHQGLLCGVDEVLDLAEVDLADD